MKTTRIACALCLVFGLRIAAAQEAFEVPSEPYSSDSVMEIAEDPAYEARVEVAQAPRPAATLQAPVVRANVPVQVLPTPTTVTPEMWIYSQELQRHDDPALAVRRKAEIRAAQRMQRIAAMKWFGFSNSRPQASTTPMMGSYSPAWIGNGYDRYDWAGTSWPTTAVRVEHHHYEIRR